jgi:hypothetical protein
LEPPILPSMPIIPLSFGGGAVAAAPAAGGGWLPGGVAPYAGFCP